MPYISHRQGVDVLTFKKFDRLSKHKKFWKSILWIFYAPMLVIGRHYDVIYCDDSYPFYPALVKLVCPRSKVVIRLGDLHLLYYYKGWLYNFLHFFEEIGWSCADTIIVISEAMKDYFWKEGYDSEVVLDPVDPADFPKLNTPRAEDTVVMFHGTLTENKGIEFMLEAAKRLPSIKFWIVGDGPAAQKLKDMAPKNVVFYGWRPFKWIYTFIHQCDVGVALRSGNPGNELVVTSPFLQYGMMAKPCLVTRRKVFRDYKWQFDSVDEFMSNLKYLLEHPEEGVKLQKFILENHEAQKIAEELWQLLQS